ncbi:helix-turn-helix domain-containing protein [Candidatus Allofournierella merdavium]|uniref:helix-turn-helix domain-containing protein n=1 Tax=Candidatus Allofournierella merdavium TaxID=2838593 RepID=UPI00374F1BE7
MGFKERLKDKRLEAGLTQAELAKKASVTTRTIQNYEMGTRRPSNMKVVGDLATALGTTVDYLMTNADVFVVEAKEKGGSKAARDIDELVSEVTGLFAGGQLSEDALEGAMRALNDAYWMAKEKNKKYAPKKYRQEQE